MKINRLILPVILLMAVPAPAIRAAEPENNPGGQRPGVAEARQRITGLIAIEILREHAVTDRLLLICEEFARRLEKQEPVPPNTLIQVVDIMYNYVQDRQEAQEEKYIFPVFIKANKAGKLIRILHDQHLAGRSLMEHLADQLRRPAMPDDDALTAASLRGFVRMYRPHLARENTILLPGFRALVSSKENYGMETDFRTGEAHRDREKGRDDDRAVMAAIVTLERALGIFDIDQFTTKISTSDATRPLLTPAF